MSTRHVIGCMTGTSLDGLDVALARITGTGLSMSAQFLGLHSAPLPGDLRDTLMSLAGGNAHTPLEIMRAARYLGVVHAQACAELIAQHAHLSSGPGQPPGGVDFVVAHGQTIWHAPADGLSWQLFDPWPIVRALNLPVCYDLRQADLIAGGQGAPITPIADWVMYREHAAMVINLGGVINVTHLASEPQRITARDVAPCNLLLDGLAMALYRQPYDQDGRIAATGTYDPALCNQVRRHIDDAAQGHRSLGREVFSRAWIDALIAQSLGAGYSKADLLCSAAHAVGQYVLNEAVTTGAGRIIVAGGGVHHPAVLAAVRGEDQPDPRPRIQALLSDDLGIPCEAREAMGFAVLGALSQDGVPISLPAVTGADAPGGPGVAGVWVYPQKPTP